MWVCKLGKTYDIFQAIECIAQFVPRARRDSRNRNASGQNWCAGKKRD
jgi:hypothetical protein